MFVVLFVSVLSSSNLKAETVVEIDKIIITESQKIETTIAPSSSHIIKSTSPKTESAADVISRTSGVHIRKFGGLESSTAVSIHGSSSQQVGIFLDGVPLQTASGEGVGLSQIATSSLAKIEIYKMFSPSEFGAGAIGGVINLSTQESEEGFSQRYGLSFGSFLTFESNANLSFGNKKNDFVFGIDYRRTKGNFSFTDNNGTPLNSNDDVKAERQNNASQNIHPHIKWRHRLDAKTEISLSSHLFYIDRGIPGLENFQSLTAHLTTMENLGSLGLKRKGLFNGKAKYTNTVFWRYIKSQFDDLDAEIGLGQAQDNDNKTVVFGDRFIWQTDFKKNISIIEGVEYINEWFLPKDYIATTSVGSSSKRQQLNLSLESHTELLKRKLKISTQLQNLNAFYSINDNDPSMSTPGTFISNRTENQFAGSLMVVAKPSQNLTLKSSAGRAVRLPQFMEMFGDQGYVLGNPQLTSEKSLKFDFGLNYSKEINKGVVKKLGFNTEFFETHTDDLIQFELSSGFSRASNIGKATVRGVEALINADFKKYFKWVFKYTFTWAKNTTNSGTFLVGRPVHEINSEVNFEKGSFSSSLDINFIDRQYLDNLNTQRINNRLILNYDAGYFIKEKYRLGLEVKNITDSQIVDAVGFPLPGRSYYGRFDVYF